MVIVASVGGALLAYGASMSPFKAVVGSFWYHPDENGTVSGFLLYSLVPFTVTKSVTILEISKAVESRAASLVFRKFPEREGLWSSFYVP